MRVGKIGVAYAWRRTGAAAGLAVMLVGEGLADGEGGRYSACNSVLLQFAGVLR